MALSLTCLSVIILRVKAGGSCPLRQINMAVFYSNILCNAYLLHTNFCSVPSQPDPAYDSGNGAYQEMKAEVTEVPASRLIPEGNHNLTGM